MPQRQKSPKELECDRDKMVTAALDIIINHGVQALTIKRIAKEFNMSAANIYNYFASKNELLFCVKSKGAEKFYEYVSGATEQHTDILEKIRAFMEAAVEFGYKNRKYYNLIISEYSDLPISNDPDRRYLEMPGLMLSDYLMRLIIEYLDPKDKNDLKVLGTFIFTHLHGLIDYNNKSIIKKLGVCYKDVCNYVFDEIIEELEKAKAKG